MFDDDRLVAHAGLVPVLRLAERGGLGGLVSGHVGVEGSAGANAWLKVGSLVAGMVAGADDIDGVDVLRHAAMGRLFGGVRAPSTLGTFLRAFDHGNVRQLQAVHRRLLAALCVHTPLLAGRDTLAFIDVDACQRRVYGPARQGAAFGPTKIAGKVVSVRGLNVLASTICTPLAAPVISGVRLRGGAANDTRGAASFIAEQIATARQAGVGGRIVVRMDSSYYNGPAISACRRAAASFSVTMRADPKVRRRIATIGEDRWRAIKYPNAIWDEEQQAWISDAEVAETSYTAFTSNRRHTTTGRMIVRRVKRLNPAASPAQDTLPGMPDEVTYRYHAVFTDSPYQLIQAEEHHRDHAIVEQTLADVIDGPLAHLPSGVFTANAAWAILAAISHNLLRAAGALTSTYHARARGATLRYQLINVPAAVSRHGRDNITVHLPREWPWANAWLAAFDATHRLPPAHAA